LQDLPVEVGEGEGRATAAVDRSERTSDSLARMIADLLEKQRYNNNKKATNVSDTKRLIHKRMTVASELVSKRATGIELGK
jgi:hypothetical protein